MSAPPSLLCHYVFKSVSAPISGTHTYNAHRERPYNRVPTPVALRDAELGWRQHFVEYKVIFSLSRRVRRYRAPRPASRATSLGCEVHTCCPALTGRRSWSWPRATLRTTRPSPRRRKLRSGCSGPRDGESQRCAAACADRTHNDRSATRSWYEAKGSARVMPLTSTKLKIRYSQLHEVRRASRRRQRLPTRHSHIRL